MMSPPVLAEGKFLNINTSILDEDINSFELGRRTVSEGADGLGGDEVRGPDLDL